MNAILAERSFVACMSVDRKGGTLAQSVSILGWSAASQNYTYRHYAQDGRSRSETCFANELRGLSCIIDRRNGIKLIQPALHARGWAVALNQMREVRFGSIVLKNSGLPLSVVDFVENARSRIEQYQ